MKLTQSLKGAVLALTMLLAVAAFASNNNKATISFADSVTVGSQTVKAGDYQVKWDGTGPDVQLNIMKGNKVVASAPAHLVDVNQASASDAAITTQNSNGTKSLTGIELAGKKFTIQVAQDSATGGTR
ncbi:MAG TPA: hypothetical protein VF753_16350 [Terriglobales bacterium]